MARANRPGIPYHRVIAAGGMLGGYSQLALKRALLAAEGLEVTPRRVRDFPRVRWTGAAVRRKAR
jgi:alkylated DNA nucleotide flippase Atl1